MTTASISNVPTTTTYDKTEDPPLAIPDKGDGLATSTILVADSFSIGELTVQINIDHSRPSDLSITLYSPAGTPIPLTPTGDTAVLDPAENVIGSWTLEITDGKNRQVGTLNSWSLTVTPAAGSSGSSYALPPVGTVGSTTAPADSIISLRKVESPRVRSTERPVSTDQLQVLLHSENEMQDKPTVVHRRCLSIGPDSDAKATDLALAELGSSFLDGKLAHLLAANWYWD